MFKDWNTEKLLCGHTVSLLAIALGMLRELLRSCYTSTLTYDCVVLQQPPNIYCKAMSDILNPFVSTKL